MFASLRAKLIVAFAAVTFLTVVLAAMGTMFLLHDREEEAARERAGQPINAVADQTLTLARAGAPLDTLAIFLQQRSEEMKVRFLLINSGDLIVADTASQLAGQPASALNTAGSKMAQSDSEGFSFTAWQDQIVYFPSTRRGFRQWVEQDFRVVMLVPKEDISAAWSGLAPKISVSGGAALVAAIGVAYLLSRSITRPVVVLTHASEAMAQGNYDQRIPVQGRDEIARLARTFNQMAHEVARTHQAMRDLNGNVAHELKTPLTSIQGYAQALLDGAVRTPEEAANAARVIYEESERMRRLVEDLLYLSRLESGQLQLERTTLSVPALLQDAAERVEWQLHDSGRTLRVQSAIDLPAIAGDKRRLEQVLANLLDNAVRYTPAGGCITLAARWSRDSVTISVHNTGSSIPPEHLSRLFERFYQADPSRARDGRHGGLGLAIAREIVAAHDGTIAATSDPVTGTEFTVVLPVRPGGTTVVGATAPVASRPADEDTSRWAPPAAIG